jgi:hypothetical protein
MTAPVAIAFNQDQTRAALTIHDPKGNIVTAAMVDALRAALESISQNPHLKLVTIEGNGPDFSFGASIPEHLPDQIGHVLPAMHTLIFDLLETPAATAALVRGRCLGGGFELALACDFIFAADNASFGLPEVALGVFPPAAAALLPLRIGAARATGAIVTGAVRSAAEWHSALGWKRGYHMHYTAEGNAVLNRPLIDAENGYLLAPMTRGIRLTTGAEFADRDAPKTPVQLDRVEPHARDVFPLGARVDAEPWLGSRPCLPDMVPIIGPAPGHKGLWLNFGHHHLGFTLGPSSGRLLAEMMTGEQTFTDPAPYRADRF